MSNDSRDKATAMQKSLTGTFPAFALLSLYDLYFPDATVPVLPLLGAAVLGIGLLVRGAFQPRAARMIYETMLTAIVLLALVCVSTFIGLLQNHGFVAKTPLGLAAGIAMFAIVAACGTGCAFLRAINIIAATHVAFVFGQLAHLLLTGHYLDYVALITGTESRYLYSTFGINIARITGLFAEPAALATFMFMLLIARAVGNGWKLRSLDYLIIATIVLSLSVYGLFLLAVFFSSRLKLTRTVGVRFILIAGFLTVLVTALLTWQTDTKEYLSSRLSDPLADPSGAVRLVEGITAFRHLPIVQQVVGLGMGSQDELVGRTNGLYFLLEKLGVVMTSLWLIVFVLMLRTGGLCAKAVIAVFVTFLGAPLLTNLFWWVWLGVLSHLGAARGRMPAERVGQLAAPPISWIPR